MRLSEVTRSLSMLELLRCRHAAKSHEPPPMFQAPSLGHSVTVPVASGTGALPPQVLVSTTQVVQDSCSCDARIQ